MPWIQWFVLLPLICLSRPFCNCNDVTVCDKRPAAPRTVRSRTDSISSEAYTRSRTTVSGARSAHVHSSGGWPAPPVMRISCDLAVSGCHENCCASDGLCGCHDADRLRWQTIRGRYCRVNRGACTAPGHQTFRRQSMKTRPTFSSTGRRHPLRGPKRSRQRSAGLGSTQARRCATKCGSRCLFSGFVMGAGICAMHYVGIIVKRKVAPSPTLDAAQMSPP